MSTRAKQTTRQSILALNVLAMLIVYVLVLLAVDATGGGRCNLQTEAPVCEGTATGRFMKSPPFAGDAVGQ